MIHEYEVLRETGVVYGTESPNVYAQGAKFKEEGKPGAQLQELLDTSAVVEVKPEKTKEKKPSALDEELEELKAPKGKKKGA